MSNEQKTYSLLADNPVYRYELKRMRWPRYPYHIGTYIQRTIVIINLLMAIIWLLGIYNNIRTCPTADFCVTPDYLVSGAAQNIMLLMLVFSVSVGFAFDLYYVMLPIVNTFHDRNTGHWELLRMTPLSSDKIVVAKFESVRLHVWRITAIEVGLRVGGIVLLLAFSLASYQTYLGAAVIVSLFSLPASWIVLFIFFWEPIWRMKTMITLGIAVSMRIRHYILALLVAVAALLAVRSIELCLFILCIYIPRSAFNPPFQAGYDTYMYVCVPIELVFIIQFFYRRIQEQLMERAFQWAKQPQ